MVVEHFASNTAPETRVFNSFIEPNLLNPYFVEKTNIKKEEDGNVTIKK